jgi:lon-related putative ATP-dependent protease
MTHEPATPLPPEALYQACDPTHLDFDTTAELPEFDDIVGQERAVEALGAGAGIPLDGFNLFVLGPPGTGRHAFVREFLRRQAAQRPSAPDWCYVNNFAEPHQPRAIRLPDGRGRTLRDDVHALIDELQTTIPAAFESEDYRTRRQALERGFQEQQSHAFQEAQRHAEERGIRVVQTPTGVTFAPVRNGEVIGAREFQQLPEQERERLEADVEALGKEFQEAMQGTPGRIRALRDRLRDLDHEVAAFAVGSLIDDLLKAYADLADVVAHLEAIQSDLVENIDLFRTPPDQPGGLAQLMVMPGRGASRDSDVKRRYGVNLLVGDGDTEGAPVVFEDHPAYTHLVGRIEHRAELGALVTDFTLIKPGALHRANHGYLVLDAHKVLTEPFAWSALKEALRRRHIRIESIGQAYSLVSTVSLEPEPIPLEVKVVLIGDRQLYYLLEMLDPEFPGLFKVAADFEDRMPRDAGSERQFARFLGSVCRRDELRPLHREAVARLIENSARDAGDAQRLSARVQNAADIVRESHGVAVRNGHDAIMAADIEETIDSRIRRQSRIRDRLQEEILRDTLIIDTSGEHVGQVNGLAVAQVGQYAFGHPSRITARLTIGSGRVIDIEREVEMGGPIHSKGVLILSGFLAAHYVTDRPLSLAATLVFEQSYGGIEGDSASSAELYALLSAIAEVPLRQGLAVTGSVNQFGRVQAIGGVNEKIEGFFDICAARGLSGEQGVLIPAANVKHLMLRRDVVEAVAAKRFCVIPVESIDQGLCLLTGLPAGERDAQGEFPEGSVNRRITDRLLQLAEQRRAFGAGQDEDGKE